jgi:C4-type Zn-finger protein
MKDLNEKDYDKLKKQIEKRLYRTKCPMCSAKNSFAFPQVYDTFYVDENVPINFIVLTCDECGFVSKHIAKILGVDIDESN